MLYHTAYIINCSTRQKCGSFILFIFCCWKFYYDKSRIVFDIYDRIEGIGCDFSHRSPAPNGIVILLIPFMKHIVCISKSVNLESTVEILKL